MTMLSWFSADLHIHTVLSPCAELDMGPINIVETARELKIDIIGITDHNAAGNVAAVMERAGQEGRWSFPAWRSRPGKKFISSVSSRTWNSSRPMLPIRERLPPVRNRPEVFAIRWW